jgi:hypothetical protein
MLGRKESFAQTSEGEEKKRRDGAHRRGQLRQGLLRSSNFKGPPLDGLPVNLTTASGTSHEIGTRAHDSVLQVLVLRIPSRDMHLTDSCFFRHSRDAAT